MKLLLRLASCHRILFYLGLVLYYVSWQIHSLSPACKGVKTAWNEESRKENGQDVDGMKQEVYSLCFYGYRKIAIGDFKRGVLWVDE